MSDQIFPWFPGLKWDRVKKPIWSTAIHHSASGKETRLAFWTYPRWQFDLSYEFLRDDATTELKTLVGFFLERQGSFDTFLYTDPYDNTILGQEISVGDGTTTKYQLLRTLGGFVEPMPNINGMPVIYLDGVLQSTGWSVDANGIITFTSAPTIGAVITADFSYYFRCRFLQDVADFSNFMWQLWELKKLQFVSVK